MDFLKFLQEIRTPVGDFLMALITHLGEELPFMAVGLIFLWCVNKRRGYYILFAGFSGTVLTQFLKITFRIPRPWVLDPNFQIVEEARLEATGYSFPSGHTQSATTLFGGIARSERKYKWLMWTCIGVVALVSFSRMYLGVHTPLDVGVSLIVGIVLVFALYPLMMKEHKSPWVMYGTLGVILLLTLANLLYVELYRFPSDVDAANLESALDNAWKMLGVVLGMCAIYPIESNYIQYDTRAVWWAQILKLVLGLIPVVLIKSLLKSPINALLGASVGNCVRYLLIVLFAGLVWPLTFKFFARLGKKDA